MDDFVDDRLTTIRSTGDDDSSADIHPELDEFKDDKSKAVIPSKSSLLGNNYTTAKEVTEDEFKRILEKSNKFPAGSIKIEYSQGKKMYMFNKKVVFTEYKKEREIPADIDD